MTSRRRPWVAPVLVVLGVFALLGGAGFLHVLLTMTGLWWLLTRTSSTGRHAATAGPTVAPQRTRPPTLPTDDALYWPGLPVAAGAAAAWYVTRDSEAEIIGDEEDADEAGRLDELDGVSAAGWYPPVDEAAATPSSNDWGGYGGGGTWGDNFGGYGGGGDWGDSDDFGGYGGGGDWGDD